MFVDFVIKERKFTSFKHDLRSFSFLAPKKVFPFFFESLHVALAKQREPQALFGDKILPFFLFTKLETDCETKKKHYAFLKLSKKILKHLKNLKPDQSTAAVAVNE